MAHARDIKALPDTYTLRDGSQFKELLMAEAANLVSVDLSAIGEDDRLHALKCCRRLSGLMDDVVQAQNLTGASGSATAPWSPATQDLAAPIYAATLPDDYQQLVVVEFERVARNLDVLDRPGRSEQLTLVRSYFASVARAIRLQVGAPPNANGSLLGDRTPAVVRVDRLARLYDQRDVVRLAAAARAVIQSLEAPETPQLSDEQLSWLTDLASGARVLDVAVKHNMSTRAMYRSLATLWRTLGAENRAQGMAAAVRLGLIEEPTERR